MHWDASKPTRNGFVHLLRETQMPTEGTGLKSQLLYENAIMAQVTYRGVKYDTNNRPNKDAKAEKATLVYRGIAVKS